MSLKKRHIVKNEVASEWHIAVGGVWSYKMRNFAEFANRYFKYADAYLECQFNGDYKKGNRAMRELVKMDEQFADDRQLYDDL